MAEEEEADEVDKTKILARPEPAEAVKIIEAKDQAGEAGTNPEALDTPPHLQKTAVTAIMFMVRTRPAEKFWVVTPQTSLKFLGQNLFGDQFWG